MELIVLGSSSAGNGYILDNGKEALILECGVPFKKVQQALDYDVRRIEGAVVTHEHGDHAKFTGQYLERAVKVCMSQGTAEALKLEQAVVICQSKRAFQLGSFRIVPFDTRHDAREPLGYLIHHKEIGTLLFATDTYYLPYRFAGLTNLLIEANYSRKLLKENADKGLIHPKQRNRILQSHLSLEACKEMLQANDISKVNNIVLIHLSSTNADRGLFQRELEALTGKNVSIATKGLRMNIDKTPF